MPISRRQPWQPWRTKDPAAEVTAVANLRIRAPLGLQATNAVTMARRAGIQAANALLLQRRNAKDPASEVTAIANLQIRQPAGYWKANEAARKRRDSSTQNANALARLQEHHQYIPDPIRSTVRQPLGLWVANDTVRRRRATVQNANAMLAWTRRRTTQEPTAIGEVNLTLRARGRSFTVGPRRLTTLRTRSRSMTLGTRAPLTIRTRSRSLTVGDR